MTPGAGRSPVLDCGVFDALAEVFDYVDCWLQLQRLPCASEAHRTCPKPCHGLASDSMITKTPPTWCASLRPPVPLQRDSFRLQTVSRWQTQADTMLLPGLSEDAIN
jgi:hypothetical protein